MTHHDILIVSVSNISSIGPLAHPWVRTGSAERSTRLLRGPRPVCCEVQPSPATLFLTLSPPHTSALTQHTVPGGVWTGALLADGTTWAMTGAQTTPAWDPRDSRDPNMPKRAPNASMLFMEKNRALIEGEGFRGNGIKGEAG